MKNHRNIPEEAKKQAPSLNQAKPFYLLVFSQVGLDLEHSVCERCEFYLLATSLTRIYVTSNALVWRSSCTEEAREKGLIS